MSSRFIYTDDNLFNRGFCSAYMGSVARLKRAMFTWITSDPTQDPLNNATSRQNLIDFCTAQGVNLLFLDMYLYVGNSNWTAQTIATMQDFVATATASGITVYALAGDIDWSKPATLSWITTNITDRIISYNSASTANQRFTGFMLDVEYWTDATQTAQNGLSGLIDLIKNMQGALSMPIGCFAPFYLKDNTGSRASVIYNSITQQEGAHMMDNADLVVVGTYRNTAGFNATDGVDGQIALFQPWYDYATANSGNIYLGSETTNVAPAYTTYFGESKATMEAQLSLDTAAFTNTVFKGHVIHSYDGWKIMT